MSDIEYLRDQTLANSKVKNNIEKDYGIQIPLHVPFFIVIPRIENHSNKKDSFDMQ